MSASITLPPSGSIALCDDNLLLRPLQPDDAVALWHAAQDEAIALYTSIVWPFTLAAAHELIADAHGTWSAGTAARFAIIDTTVANSPLFAGTASLLHIYPERSDAEIGYWLSPVARGRGLARRAVALLTAWGFDVLGLQRLHLGVDPPNTPSHTVATANGYVACGEEMWRHPTDPTKDGIIVVYERLSELPSQVP